MITKSRYAISAMSLGVTLAFTVSPPVTALFQATELRQASAVRLVDRGQPQLEVVADAVGRTPQNPTGTETRDPAGRTLATKVGHLSRHGRSDRSVSGGTFAVAVPGQTAWQATETGARK